MPGPQLTGKHLLAVYVAGRTCPAPTALRGYEFFGKVTRMVVPVPT